MFMRYSFLFFLLFCNPFFSDALIQKEPLCLVYTPNSILQNKDKYQPLFIGSRTRWATCTGAVWFHDDYLATLNLYGRKITTYAFDARTMSFKLFQEFDNSHGASLTNSENLTVSPDGSLLAVCSGPPYPGLKMYSIDLKTHLIDPKPLLKKAMKDLVHNVRFTPDGSYLAVTQWERDESVALYKISRNSHNITLKNVYKQANINPARVAKGINFTKDGRFAAIVYSAQAQSGNETLYDGLVAIHRFDAQIGTIGEQISSVIGSFCCEDIAFIDNDHIVVCSDQNNDTLTIYAFDPISGELSDTYAFIKGVETRLYFPHGLAVKQDNAYLVVTNYGDDSFNLYRLV